MILATHGIVGSQTTQLVGLLDLYPNAAAAYSLRLLRTNYTGSAIRVRRASDNTEQNIGFTALGGLDTSSLSTFCRSTNGFVTTWYDQSNNGYNATQTTAANQPQIVSSGSVILESGKPALQFDGINDFFTNNTINISQPITRFSTAKSTNTTSKASVLTDSNTATDRFVLYSGGIADNAGNFATSYDNTGANINTTNNANRNLFYEIANSGSNAFALNAGTQITGNNGSNGMNKLSIGNIRSIVVANYAFVGNFQELVIYNSNESANRTGISNNINSYYGIY
jgi:hypothetical protein